MQRFDESTTEADLEAFVQTLQHQKFTHKDVMNCYSIYTRNEYQKNKDNPTPSTEFYGRQRAGGKRIPIRWSQEEINALQDGVATFGKGCWAQIIELHSHIFGPTARTGRDLKKKWTSLEKSKEKQLSSQQQAE